MLTLRRVASLALAAACFLIMQGCRDRATPAKTQGPSAKVLISIQNVLDVDKVARRFTYRLGGCGSGGTFDGSAEPDSGPIAFQVKGVKAGDQCNLQLIQEDAATESEISFKSGENVMYEASAITIGQDLKGQFIGTAFLKRTYFFQGSMRYTVFLPVTFLGTRPDGKFASELKCDPAISLVSEAYKQNDEKSGEFTYYAAARPDLNKSIKCTEVNIFKDNKRIFTGSFPIKQILPKAGESFKLSDAPVELKAVIETPEGIIVDTGSTTTSCKEGEAFDLESRSCKPKK
jgi:hypothetical protein